MNRALDRTGLVRVSIFWKRGCTHTEGRQADQPTARLDGAEAKAAAVRMFRTLRAKLGIINVQLMRERPTLATVPSPYGRGFVSLISWRSLGGIEEPVKVSVYAGGQRYGLMRSG